MLVLLYYLSQNESFAESVKPIMAKLKDSQEMLRFLNDLSKFSETFSGFQTTPPPQSREGCEKNGEKEKSPQSPTAGIADEFIQNILDSYLNKSGAKR